MGTGWGPGFHQFAKAMNSAKFGSRRGRDAHRNPFPDRNVAVRPSWDGQGWADKTGCVFSRHSRLREGCLPMAWGAEWIHFVCEHRNIIVSPWQQQFHWKRKLFLLGNTSFHLLLSNSAQYFTTAHPEQLLGKHTARLVQGSASAHGLAVARQGIPPFQNVPTDDFF